MEPLYNLRETAKLLGVKVRTLREWIRNKRMEANKFGGSRWYVRESEIKRLQGE